MAKQDFNLSFKNCTISLQDNEIVEYPTKKDEEIKTYVLSDIINKLQGEDRRFTINIRESIDLVPSELG
jgi:hypothetical protein